MEQPFKWYTWRDKLRCFFHGHQWKEYTDHQYYEVTGRSCFSCGKEEKIVKKFKTKK